MSATANPASRHAPRLGSIHAAYNRQTAVLPNRLRYLLPALLLLLATQFITGCMTLVDTEGSQEQRSDAIITLTDGSEFRQTFTSRRAGLNRIEMWLRPPDGENQAAGYVTAELWRSPEDPAPLAEALFTPAQIKASADSISLSFPPQADSESSTYELRLRSSAGDVKVFGRFEDVYGPGTAAQDGSFLLVDAAFRLAYQYDNRSFLEDIGQILVSGWLFLPLAAIVLLPGWLLLVWGGADRLLDAGEKTGMALGLSLATIPLVMAWTSFAGLTWSRRSVTATAVLLVLLAVFQGWRRMRSTKRLQTTGSPAEDPAQSRDRLAWIRSGPTITISLIVVFTITLVVRFAMVRDLSAAPWVDSVHHALITRLILEGGAFPTSLAPALQIDATSYHPGFHSLLAAFLWLTDLSMERGMLYFGQVLNALSVFSVYLFTTTLLDKQRGRRLAGLLAALVAGLFTPMPAYYTSWGRYTQLAAMIILPAAFALLLRSLRAEQPPGLSASRAVARYWKTILLAAIAAGGLILTHYRVTAFFVCLLLAYAAVQAARWVVLRRSEGMGIRWAGAGRTALTLAVTAAAALVLAAPWLVPSLQGLLLPRLSAWIPPSAEPFSGVTWPYLNTAWGNYAIVLGLLGLVVGILQRRAFPWVLVLWVGQLLLLANMGMFGLPGSGFVNSISVTISLYLPMAVSAGYVLAQAVLSLYKDVPSRGRGAFRWLLAGVGVLVAVLAARQLIPLLNPVTFLFRAADRPAIEWAEANIPQGETVLVGPFAWGYGQYAGNDGGYWISALTQHPTFPPPVLYGLSNSPEYIQNINATSQQVIDSAGDPQALHTLLTGQDIRYVFIGGRGGVLSAQLLRGSPSFAPRYARDGVFIFEVLQ